MPPRRRPFTRFHAEAPAERAEWTPGGYEPVGPEPNGNPECRAGHQLLRHAEAEVLAVPLKARDFG